MFVVDEVIHYCVANMPGGVPVTSTKALTNATLPYVEAIADRGLAGAVAADGAPAKGPTCSPKITYEAWPRRTASNTRRLRLLSADGLAFSFLFAGSG